MRHDRGIFIKNNYILKIIAASGFGVVVSTLMNQGTSCMPLVAWRVTPEVARPPVSVGRPYVTLALAIVAARFARSAPLRWRHLCRSYCCREIK